MAICCTPRMRNGRGAAMSSTSVASCARLGHAWGMSWALAILMLVLGGVLGMLLTMRKISRAKSEQARDLASVAFWLQLGVLGVVLIGAFAQPMARYGWFDTEAGVVTAGLMSIMP